MTNLKLKSQNLIIAFFEKNTYFCTANSVAFIATSFQT